ncbi:MAG: hypothetical protein GX221_06740 [Candidatus Riflebacteria bacterium]|nr:hypothetical protein [Candidatus Riflebacteria bacterium]
MTNRKPSSSIPGWIHLLFILAVFFILRQVSTTSREKPPRKETAYVTIDTSALLKETTQLITPVKSSSVIPTPFSNLITTAPVNDILIEPDGSVWAATEEGAATYINGHITEYTSADGTFPFEQATSLLLSKDTLFVSGFYGVAKRTKNKFITSNIDISLIWDSLQDGASTWFSTQTGLYLVTEKDENPVKIDKDSTNNGLRYNWCRNLLRTGSKLFIIQDSCLSIWELSLPASNPNSWKRIEYSDLNINSPVNSVGFDGTHLWLATNSGLFRILPPLNEFGMPIKHSAELFTTLNNLPSNKINTVLGHKGNLWVGTEQGLAVVTQGGSIKQIVPDKPYRPLPIRALSFYGEILWIGTDSGLQFINTAMFQLT